MKHPSRPREARRSSVGIYATSPVSRPRAGASDSGEAQQGLADRRATAAVRLDGDHQSGLAQALIVAAQAAVPTGHASRLVGAGHQGHAVDPVGPLPLEGRSRQLETFAS